MPIKMVTAINNDSGVEWELRREFYDKFVEDFRLVKEYEVPSYKELQGQDLVKEAEEAAKLAEKEVKEAEEAAALAEKEAKEAEEAIKAAKVAASKANKGKKAKK